MIPSRLVQAAAALALALPAWAQTAPLAAVPAQPGSAGADAAYDGVVEAVRQTVVAAQVAGAIVQLDVKAGDRVGAGQLLLRIDARAADQNAVASTAQVQAAKAALEVTTRELERQRTLYQKHYISQAALDRAESEYKAGRAQVDAQLAQAGAARTQSGFYVVRAPFAGIVSQVPVTLGDMAMPGRPLLTLYDPTVLRVTAAVPQSVASQLVAGRLATVVLPGLPAAAQRVTPTALQQLPAVDPATHTVELRAALPGGLAGVAPGAFARLVLPLNGDAAGANVTVPLQSVVRRAEVTGLYVLDAAGKPLLRQVRLGAVDGDRVQVLTGLAPGERVVTDPQAAAHAR